MAAHSLDNKRMISFFGSDGTSQQILRRLLAQIFFFASGACAVFFFGGVETWAQRILGLILGICCLLEATIGFTSVKYPSRKVIIFVAALFFWLILSLIPWPYSWAAWLTPGQVKLLTDMGDWRPLHLHGSMAYLETSHALFLLIGTGVVIYLSWLWSSHASFRFFMNVFILILGFIAALLGFLDRLSDSHLLYWIRPTFQKNHWGPFINGNHLSNYLNICAIIGLGIFFRCIFPRRDQKKRFFLGSLTLIIAVFCMCISMLTASKGGLFSLGIGLIFFTALLLRQRALGTRSRLMIIGLLCFLGFLMFYGRPILHRVEVWIRSPVYSESGIRSQYWKDSWRMGMDMRGRGIGIGAFETVFPIFQTSQGNKTITHPENEYLQLWVEWGFFGSIIWIVLFGMLIFRGVQTLRGNPSEWQIAGWTALVVTAIHASVDFPMHIPANAWLVTALVGMLVRGHSENGIVAHRKIQLREFASPMRLGLMSVGLGLLFPAIIKLPARKEIFNDLEQHLTRGEYEKAWVESKKNLDRWPFYWRAHELAGYSAAGIDSKNREVQSCFQRAQQLSPLNPMISFRGGILFLPFNLAVAKDFFETSLSIADRPEPIFWDILNLTKVNPDWIERLMPLATHDSTLWLSALEFLISQKQTEKIHAWLEVGIAEWLDHPTERIKVIRALMRNGDSGPVLNAFVNAPPKTPEEYYWEARAYEHTGDLVSAIKVYRKIWEQNTPAIPKFSMAIEINPWTLREGGIDPDNISLQLKLGETLTYFKRYEEAIPSWQRVLVIEPENGFASYGLTQAYENLGRLQEAVKIWRRMVERRLKLDV